MESCANVVLALRVRERDASLLEVWGATPRQVCVASALEAFMHVVAAGSVALLAVVLSNMIAVHALGLDISSAVLSVCVAPAAFYCRCGFRCAGFGGAIASASGVCERACAFSQ